MSACNKIYNLERKLEILLRNKNQIGKITEQNL